MESNELYKHLKDQEKMTANAHQVGGSHYNKPIQHWDYVVANNIPYLEAQIIRYASRLRDKNGMEDLFKMRHYVDKLIEVEMAKERGERAVPKNQILSQEQRELKNLMPSVGNRLDKVARVWPVVLADVPDYVEKDEVTWPLT